MSLTTTTQCKLPRCKCSIWARWKSTTSASCRGWYHHMCKERFELKYRQSLSMLSSRPIPNGNRSLGQISQTTWRAWLTKHTQSWRKQQGSGWLSTNTCSSLNTLKVAFSVKQKWPAKLDEAVSATLEMEVYTLNPELVVASVQGEEERGGESAVAVVGAQDPLSAAVEWLTARLQKLENECYYDRKTFLP